MNYSIVTLDSKCMEKLKVGKIDKEDKHILNQNISFSICQTLMNLI